MIFALPFAYSSLNKPLSATHTRVVPTSLHLSSHAPPFACGSCPSFVPHSVHQPQQPTGGVFFHSSLIPSHPSKILTHAYPQAKNHATLCRKRHSRQQLAFSFLPCHHPALHSQPAREKRPFLQQFD